MTCEEKHCFFGYIFDYGDSTFFNGHDVYHEDSELAEKIKTHDLGVWVFGFCPKCGKPIDRQAVAEKLGINLEKCDGN